MVQEEYRTGRLTKYLCVDPGHFTNYVQSGVLSGFRVKLRSLIIADEKGEGVELCLTRTFQRFFILSAYVD